MLWQKEPLSTIVRQLDTQLRAHRGKKKAPLYSIKWPIIKTGMPQWQLESHLLSICTPETPCLLFQKSHSNCHWLKLLLLKCSRPSQYPLKTLPSYLMEGCLHGCLRQDKPSRFSLRVIKQMQNIFFEQSYSFSCRSLWLRFVHLVHSLIVQFLQPVVRKMAYCEVSLRHPHNDMLLCHLSSPGLSQLCC